jgi:hypothetical protein
MTILYGHKRNEHELTLFHAACNRHSSSRSAYVPFRGSRAALSAAMPIKELRPWFAVTAGVFIVRIEG